MAGEDGVPDDSLGVGVAWLGGGVDGLEEDLLGVPVEEGGEVWRQRVSCLQWSFNGTNKHPPVSRSNLMCAYSSFL
jgi:hypothetical protein